MAIWADRAGHLWTWDLFLEGSVAQKVAGLELQAAVTCLHADPSGSHQVRLKGLHNLKTPQPWGSHLPARRSAAIRHAAVAFLTSCISCSLMGL